MGRAAKADDDLKGDFMVKIIKTFSLIFLMMSNAWYIAALVNNESGLARSIFAAIIGLSAAIFVNDILTPDKSGGFL